MEQYETEEQQVEAIKRFWKENGTALIIGAVLGFGGLLGWRYYNDSQLAAKEEASFAYEKATQQLVKGEAGFSEAKTFLDDHSDTGYATLMALELAQQAIERKDLKEAAMQLTFVADNANLSAIRSVAQLRLARIQIEQGELENAIERAVILTDDNEISTELLGLDIEGPDLASLEQNYVSQTPPPSRKAVHDNTGSAGLSLDDYFQRFVLENQDCMSETELAKKLGVSRKCLWERRQKLGIPRKPKK